MPSRHPSPSPRRNLPRRAACARLLLAAAALTTAGSARARQSCRFPDGERRVVYQSLVSAFGLSVSDCHAMPSTPDETPDSDAPRPTEGRVEVIVIEAPGPRSPAPVLRADMPPTRGDAPGGYQRLIANSARNHGIDPRIVEAVIWVESRFQPLARSGKGALGLMQVMPQTARQYGVTAAGLFDPATNIECGTRYLGELTAAFAGRLDLALAAYNAGPGAVVRHGWRVPPFAETEAYVANVLQRFKALR